jgi:hypothetical protein
MSHLCNRCVRELLILACTWFAFGLPSKSGVTIVGYDQDTHAANLRAQLAMDQASMPNFTLVDGLLRYKSIVWIGHNVPLRQKPLSACHASALGGHSGFPVTYMRMKKLFAWTDMRAVVKQFVQTCLVC